MESAYIVESGEETPTNSESTHDTDREVSYLAYLERVELSVPPWVVDLRLELWAGI